MCPRLRRSTPAPVSKRKSGPLARPLLEVPAPLHAIKELTMKQDSTVSVRRAPYVPPELVVHGDVTSLTQQSGNNGNGNGFGRLSDGGPHS